MPKLLLRITVALLAITIVGISVALGIGQNIPAEMLTATLYTRNLSYTSEEGVILIDLNRHLRVRISIPIEGAISPMVDLTGHQIYVQVVASEKHYYVYNLLTQTLRELNVTYSDPQTDERYQRENIFYSMENRNTYWHYNFQTSVFYRLDTATHTMQPVIDLSEHIPSFRLIDDHGLPLVSPSHTQAAFIDRFTIYMFNTDGSNLRQFENPIDGIYSNGYWSQDERYFFVYGGDSFRVFDLNSGDILPSTRDLYGSTFLSCWQSEWLSYVDARYEAQLLNYQTGETVNLSLAPELIGQRVDSAVWLAGCEWLIVSMYPQNNNSMAGFLHQQLYIVSRDGQTIYSLGEQVSIVNWMTNDRFLLAETQGTQEMLYDTYFDGIIHQTPVNAFIPIGNLMTGLQGDPYRLLVYDPRSSSPAVLNLRTGVIDTYFAADEVVGFITYWRWE